MQVPFPNDLTSIDTLRTIQQFSKALNGGIRLLNTSINATTFVRDNLDGWPIQFTSPVAPNTEFAVPHGLGRIPNGRLILWQDKAASLYQGPTTGTAWTSTLGAATGNAFFKCDIASVTFLILLV